MSISKNPATEIWRKQFTDPDDYDLVGLMLDKFKFVSASEFRTDMHEHIISSIPTDAKAAFFIEREFQLVTPKWRYKKWHGYEVVHENTTKISVGMYKEEATSRGRGKPKKWTAEGPPQQPVKSRTNLTQEIGSEGLVTTLVSKVCGAYPDRFMLHPYASALRKAKVQYLVIVTDFIGSGNRTKQMLDSLWRVATIRSWKSSKYIEIMVICYSATDYGFEQVEQHPSCPIIKRACTCPSISTSFSLPERYALESLCERVPQGSKYPLGYEKTAALIAFEHSCPNNVPAMFVETIRSKKGPWTALFPKRTTNEVSKNELLQPASDGYSEALETLRCGRICENGTYLSSSSNQRAMIVILAAVYRGHRHQGEIVTICGLPLVEVVKAWTEAQRHGLLTGTLRLTADGFALLSALLKPRLAKRRVANSANSNYYPSSLREPIVAS